jgi:hypothetical protein
MALFCVVIEKTGWPWQPAFDSLSTSLPPTRAGSRRTWAREGRASRRRLRPIWYENDEDADRRKQSDTVKVEGHLELTGEAAKATARSAWVRRRTGTGERGRAGHHARRCRLGSRGPGGGATGGLHGRWATHGVASGELRFDKSGDAKTAGEHWCFGPPKTWVPWWPLPFLRMRAGDLLEIALAALLHWTST